MIITICSSVDFSPKIIEIKKELENKGHIVNIPYFTQLITDGKFSFEEYLRIKEEGKDINLRMKQEIDLIQRYWDLIKNSDVVLVLNTEKKGVNGYIGGNTLIEMGFAYVLKKKIYLFNPIPKRNIIMHYIDEIKDIDPIVINGNLSLLEI